MQCAIRETYEEVGVDLSGLLKTDDYIEIPHGLPCSTSSIQKLSMVATNTVCYTVSFFAGQKKLGMFLYAGVPMDLPLLPVQQNETMEIRWLPIFGEHGLSSTVKAAQLRKEKRRGA